MSDIQNFEQIEADHPSEWVLIGEPQIADLTGLIAGRVLFHSRNRDEVYRKAVELRLPHFAVRYFGAMPENMALILSRVEAAGVAVAPSWCDVDGVAVGRR